MTTAGHPEPGTALWALTLSLLRFGSDTSATRALKALAGTEPSQLLDLLMDKLGIPPADRPRRIEHAASRAEEALAKGGAAGLQPIPWFSPQYPPLLAEIPDPPMVVWTAGSPATLVRPAVAIVGARRAAPMGVRLAKTLGRGLAEAGLVVVSGLARGIDAAAHEGALETGTTVGVLGCGADIIYPPEHEGLAADIRRVGALVSEFPPGMPPLAHHFPMRNRIISGLCRAVVVIEASERSGSLITARMALDQGRDVLAVPGSVVSGQYAGCHALIKDGAALVETVNDVLGAMGWPRRSCAGRQADSKSRIVSRLEGFMAVGEPYTVDELAVRTKLSGPELLAELSALEVAGIIGRIPGAGFVRLPETR